METITYKGTVYQVHEFTNEYPHVEPCGECAFGSTTTVGVYPRIIKGKTVMAREGGWTCHKPQDAPPCTAVRREDKRNVYFTRLYDTNSKGEK